MADTAVEKAVGYVTIAIVGGLIAVIALTGVTLAASPLAFVLVPAGILGVFCGQDWIKEKLLTFEFEGDALGWLQKLYGSEKLEGALVKGDQECRKTVTDTIEQAMKGVRLQFDRLIAKARDEVLRRYGLLDKLSRLPAGR